MSRKLDAQENVRLTAELKRRFDQAIDKGNYCKSAVIRSLVEDWVVKVERG